MCCLILDRNTNIRLLVGVGNGFLSTSVYTVEIVKAELRGSFSVFEGVARSLGNGLSFPMSEFNFARNLILAQNVSRSLGIGYSGDT